MNPGAATPETRCRLAQKPCDMPRKSLRSQLSAEVVKVPGADADLIGSTPKEASERLNREVALWSRVVKEAGVKASD